MGLRITPSRAHVALNYEPEGLRYELRGVSTRLSERPEGRRLFDILRSGDTLVVRWVDRLGRNYRDVTDTVREFIRRGMRDEDSDEGAEAFRYDVAVDSMSAFRGKADIAQATRNVRF
jgi:DNA invertase Pin-like site-specific DNA recombinase